MTDAGSKKGLFIQHHEATTPRNINEKTQTGTVFLENTNAVPGEEQERANFIKEFGNAIGILTADREMANNPGLQTLVDTIDATSDLYPLCNKSETSVAPVTCPATERSREPSQVRSCGPCMCQPWRTAFRDCPSGTRLCCYRPKAGQGPNRQIRTDQG